MSMTYLQVFLGTIFSLLTTWDVILNPPKTQVKGFLGQA
jgi:hypothetical protein